MGLLPESNVQSPSSMNQEEMSNQQQPQTWSDTAWSVGENMLYVADFLGEVFAEFFGMTQSRYQWAVDAYERQQRWEKEEKDKEEYHKKLVMDAVRGNNKDIANDIEIDQSQIKLSVSRPEKENNDEVVYEKIIQKDCCNANEDNLTDAQLEQVEDEAIELKAKMNENKLLST